MLQAFQEIIFPAAIINFSTDINGVLILKENAPESKIKKLSIQGVPEQSFAFTLDHKSKQDDRWFKQLSCYVNPSNEMGVNKSCDLVVVSFKDNQWQILIFDLKSDKPNITETEMQLFNSELYVRYIVSMIKHHYKIDIDSLNIRYQRTIVTTKIAKGSIYSPNSRRQKSNNSFLPVPVQPKNQEATVHFGKLLGL